MKKTTIILSVFSTVACLAQVGGLSAGRLTIPSASILEKGNFEFEPAFYVTNSSYLFDNEGNSYAIREHNITSSFDFRLTAGITAELEVGTTISSSIEEIIFGTKYRIINNDKLEFALTGGVALPAGNKTVADTLLRNEFIYSLSIGPAVTCNLSKKTSFDFAIAYTTALNSSDFADLIYAGIGIGYMVTDEFQAIVELAGNICYDNKICTSILSLFPGITYNISDNVSFAFGTQYDLMGKNEKKCFGYFGAITMIFK